MSRDGPSAPTRARLAAVIPRRPKVSWPIALALAVGFTVVVTPVILAEAWIGGLEIRAGEPAPVTVRVPEFAGLATPDAVVGGGAIVVSRGEVPDADRARLAQAAQAAQPRGRAGLLAYIAIVLMLSGLYTYHLRRSHRGQLLRVQLVNLGVIAAVALVVKLLLLLTPMSVLIVPVALAAVVPTIVFDRTVGLATGVLMAILVSLLVPFDVGVATVLVVQASVGGVLIPERTRSRWRVTAVGSVLGAATGALVYGVVHYLSTGDAPVHQLAHPLQSSWVAAMLGGLLAGLGTALLTPLYQLLVGEITQAKLVALEDLSHPLLRQIAEKSPGTWQHSLAMANLAEIAANAIGASGRLVRVGAYFHDLGKSLQPKYFIENLEAGESSPHDRLPPDVSCDAIFAHVTEGLAVARRARLPERIIDFMHMHHGDGVLEYFWSKCKDQGNPKGLTMADFRYPGVPPQSRETAILAICDAVEAASRTLKRPDDHAVASLVQRIVYGKLHLGQLDESGLSMADLRKISDSLRETIKHAHHGRIEYPWQRAEREAAELESATPATAAALRAPAVGTAEGDGVVRGQPASTTTARIMEEPRLDSLDVPRPLWRDAREPREPRGNGFARAGSDNETRALAPRDAGVATTDLLPPAMARGTGDAAGAAAPRAVIDEAAALHRVHPPQARGAAPDALAVVATGEASRPTATAADVPASDGIRDAPLRDTPDATTPDAAPAGAVAEERTGKRRTAPPPPPGSSPAIVPPPPPGSSPAIALPSIPPPPAEAPPGEARVESLEAPRSRTPSSTLEIEADDVESVIELSPVAASQNGGPIIGPPPATRKARAAVAPRPVTTEEEPAQEPASPPASMLPPRTGSTKPPAK